MPFAGQIIRALDRTAEASAADPTTIDNVSATTPQVGTTPVAVTVICPTSGKIRVQPGGGGRDNAGTNRIFFEALVREDDQNGDTVFQSEVATDTGTSSIPVNVATPTYAAGVTWIVPGLDPGRPYWCAVTYRASSGSTADVISRSIYAGPAS